MSESSKLAKLYAAFSPRFEAPAPLAKTQAPRTAQPGHFAALEKMLEAAYGEQSEIARRIKALEDDRPVAQIVLQKRS